MQPSNRQFADADEFLDHLAGLFASHDAEREIDGRLSNSAHMLQTAAAAEAADAEAYFIAWFRDESVNAQTVDRRHESVGAPP